MGHVQMEDFDVGAIVAKRVAKNRRIGGVVTFLGVARDFSRGKNVKKLEFEHYAGMAESELDHLEREARKSFDIIDCYIVHRIGEIGPGENIVLIVVTAEHRVAAFDACEWAIDTLKQKVPIWKKEFTTDGESWIGEHP
jgi:molybdopterin synthase catalytic subunit